jgi:hypothetical protein
LVPAHVTLVLLVLVLLVLVLLVLVLLVLVLPVLLVGYNAWPGSFMDPGYVPS